MERDKRHRHEGSNGIGEIDKIRVFEKTTYLNPRYELGDDKR
jgi:hypothetical protein